MNVTSTQAAELIPTACMQRLAVMLHSHPGMGKSDIVRQIAAQYKLKLIDERMSTCDPVNLSGFPVLGERRASFLPFDTFPLEDDIVPIGFNGWLIFLDELNSAPKSVQAACYKLILDRMVGNKKLHSSVWIVAAGNLVTSGAIVNPLGTAMQSRLVHLQLEVTAKQWIKWGQGNDIDHRILAYINRRPDNLNHMDLEKSDHTFACSRTWEFCSRLTKNIRVEDLQARLPLLAGCVSEGMAREFLGFTEIYANLPSYADIVRDPKSARLDTEPNMICAASQMIAAHTDKTDIDRVIDYIERLPIEFQVITYQGIMQRDPSLIHNPKIISFMAQQGSDVFT